MIANTTSYEELELTITTRNVKVAYTECLAPTDIGKLLVLTHPVTAHMAEGNSKPFCQGVQACDVIHTQMDTTTLMEQHTILCRCHGGACTDLALLLSEGMAVNPAVPMEICDVRPTRAKLYDTQNSPP